MEQLAWLPPHADFRAAIKAARTEPPAQRLHAAAALTGFARDFVETDQLARVVDAAFAELGGIEQGVALGLTPTRVAFLGSHTLDHLMPAVRVGGLSRRLALSTWVAPYGLYRQVLSSSDESLSAFAPQFVVLALDAYDLSFDLPLDSSEEQVAAAVQERIDALRRLWASARERYGAKVIQQTVLPSTPNLFGSFEALVPAAPGTLIQRLNDGLRRAAREDSVLLLDLAAHPASSTELFVDAARWHQAKQLVSPRFAPLYGDLVARIVAAARGLSRKCLVLDLDNTLWGGVIGDDGIEGIKLGNGDSVGEAFLSFQRYAALLARRGVVLAVCSKNDLSVAEAAFSTHPEMALTRKDIACFVANWDDKAKNLRHIAKTLDLGVDSLVFVDDNPAERAIIRRELPEVAVPELPDDVAFYASTVAAAGYFESVGFTADDIARNSNYAANIERRAVLEQATDLDGYLRSLEMTLLVSPIGAVELPRVVQLINKSNQFNLTTKRYTEPELTRALDDPRTLAFCLRLIDRFSDNGLISVIVARPDEALADGELLLDTWLMSCRVLGRQVEAAALEVLTQRAAGRGAHTLVGEYRPTPRNGMVAQHYAKLGFVPREAPPQATPDATFWRFDVTAAAPQHFIQLKETT
jgi:FkbH-like protein